jgi:hypothetical protein
MSLDISKFLINYGYLAPENAGNPTMVSDAIAGAQESYGLPQTGNADEMTAKVIERTPRCGMSDAPQHTIGKPHWGLKSIAWCMTQYPAGVGLTRQAVDGAIGQAFSQWSAVCGLTFKQVLSEQQANIVIGVGRGRRADFDGPSGTLASRPIRPLPGPRSYPRPRAANRRGRTKVRRAERQP